MFRDFFIISPDTDLLHPLKWIITPLKQNNTTKSIKQKYFYFTQSLYFLNTYCTISILS